MVSCQKGPTRHACARQIGPFWQDTLELLKQNFELIVSSIVHQGWHSRCPEVRLITGSVEVSTRVACVGPHSTRTHKRSWVRDYLLDGMHLYEVSFNRSYCAGFNSEHLWHRQMWWRMTNDQVIQGWISTTNVNLGPCLNIKTTFPGIGKLYYEYKTVVPPSYLYDGNIYTDNTT